MDEPFFVECKSIYEAFMVYEFFGRHKTIISQDEVPCLIGFRNFDEGFDLEQTNYNQCIVVDCLLDETFEEYDWYKTGYMSFDVFDSVINGADEDSIYKLLSMEEPSNV